MYKSSDCIFCKIIAKEIPAHIVHEEEHFLAIRDINPQAPTHILILPKHHITNLIESEDALELGKLFQAARSIAAQENLKAGFRLVVNCGPHGGQTVDHLHIHLLGGRAMTWPPG